MKKRRKKQMRKGFTMIELMAVLIILGLLATVLVRNFMGQTDKARVITTKANLKILHAAVMQFKMDTGRFPFVIISYGADGEEGGESYDTDLYSTDAF